jgi:IclR family transcriptional regulator, mhp operon transcriptional activator
MTVLRVINRHGSLSMMSIAKASGLSYPTTFRLVRTLMHEGLVEQEVSRKHYRPTALVQELSIGYRPYSQLVTIARPHLEALTKLNGWPVSIATPVGMSMVLRDSTHADTTLTFEHYPPGFTFPLTESASGILFLAYALGDVVDNVKDWLREKDGAEDELKHFPTQETLQRVRAQGYASLGWGQHNLNPGRTSAISVPIFRKGNFEAALTLVYFAAAMKPAKAIERYLDTLIERAQMIGGVLDGAST